MEVTARRELAGFLRRSRERLSPQDVGLAAGRHRRTPGLRRQEVAQLAAISVDYYIRLEQGRGPRPSPDVLRALGRALQLSLAEQRYLHELAGGPAQHRGDRRLGISPAIAQLLDRFEDAPVTVCDAALDIIASNNVGTALVGDLSGASPDERNVVWRFFMRAGARDRHDPATVKQLAAELVSDLRMAAARHPGDGRIGGLVERLRDGSEEFRELWESAPVVAHRSSRKRINHPVVGWLDLDCTSLHDPDRDQWVVIHTAQIGSPSHEDLRLLKVLGTQQMSSQSG
jgi:transcriptional regulator with XRE-family HTH domain